MQEGPYFINCRQTTGFPDIEWGHTLEQRCIASWLQHLPFACQCIGTGVYRDGSIYLTDRSSSASAAYQLSGTSSSSCGWK